MEKRRVGTGSKRGQEGGERDRWRERQSEKGGARKRRRMGTWQGHVDATRWGLFAYLRRSDPRRRLLSFGVCIMMSAARAALLEPRSFPSLSAAPVTIACPRQQQSIRLNGKRGS